MARPVSLYYDDGSKTDFNDVADALFHLKTQGLAGVVELREPHEDVACDKCSGTGFLDTKKGSKILTRAQLNDHVKSIDEESPDSVEDTLKVTRKIAKEI